MTAICPAGPPKVCSEMANQARAASRSEITSWECACACMSPSSLVAKDTVVEGVARVKSANRR